MPSPIRDIAGTGATSGSGEAWNDPSNITADDASAAQVTLTAGAPTSQLLVATNFDFSALPAGAAITKVEAEYEIVATGIGATGTVSTVQAWDGSAVAGNNIAGSTTFGDGIAEAVFVLGDSSWGWWTTARLKTTTNGFVIRCSRSAGSVAISIDYVALTVYYTTPGSPTMISRSVKAQAGAIHRFGWANSF